MRYDKDKKYPLITDSFVLSQLIDIKHDDLRMHLKKLSCEGLITTSKVDDYNDPYNWSYMFHAKDALQAAQMIKPESYQDVWSYWLSHK